MFTLSCLPLIRLIPRNVLFLETKEHPLSTPRLTSLSITSCIVTHPFPSPATSIFPCSPASIYFAISHWLELVKGKSERGGDQSAEEARWVMWRMYVFVAGMGTKISRLALDVDVARRRCFSLPWLGFQQLDSPMSLGIVPAITGSLRW